ncbi:MAG: hypothetical protein H6732_03515 [Alphaproteobacteria bacterium]|nr:hypothetical protein [Alphaproteobacteria bacterium]
MIGLYLAALAFGSVLVGASVVLGGGHDADGDADLGGDGDLGDADLGGDGDLGDADLGDADLGDGHGGHGVADDLALAPTDGTPIDWLWLPFLSMRFWSFFAASFGAIGSALSVLGLGEVVTAVVAGSAGTLTGWSAAAVLRRVQSESVSGETSLARFVGEEARVVLTVRPGGTGLVRLHTAAGDVEVPATTRDGKDLSAGTQVLIAGFHGRSADVTGLPSLPEPEVR